jgi:arginine:ornithine antiporter / lysine permease
MTNRNNKLNLPLLIALCVGPMFGSGLFALPYNTGIVGMLIAWLITFVGMISLATVFQNLSMRRPDLDVGIYSYAKAGLGDYLGFNSAWGYWISVMLGNAGYIIMLCAGLSIFSSSFGDGTSYLSLVVGSSLIWIVTLLCIYGLRSAALLNLIITIIKIIPIIVFILVITISFKSSVFTANFLHASEFGALGSQIKKMMLVTVWIFIGIEGASVLSARAQKRSDIGKANDHKLFGNSFYCICDFNFAIWGFCLNLILLLCLCHLPAHYSAIFALGVTRL